MAKPNGALGKAKKDAAFQRRLDRGANKLAAQAARTAARAAKKEATHGQ